MSKYIALFSSDWHIRDTVPIARNSTEYLQAQWDKIKFILRLAKDKNVPVIIAGDVGNVPEWSNGLLTIVIRLFKKYCGNRIICIPGQHDLPNHNLSFIEFESGLGVLKASGVIDLFTSVSALSLDEGRVGIHFYPYSQSIQHGIKKYDFKIAVIHELVVEKKNEFGDGINDFPMAKDLLNRYSEYDLIVSGDNHNAFMIQKDRRVWLNCGSLMRMTSAQIDHKPKVYLLDDEYVIHPVLVPIKEGVVSREHIEKNDLMRNLSDTFIDGIEEDYELGMSFEKNLKSFFNENKTKIRVKNKVWGAVDVGTEKNL